MSSRRGRPRGQSKTGGAKKGSKVRVTADIRALCQEYSKEAVDCIVAVMRSETALDRDRLTAAREILDRAHGKPAQSVEGPGGGPVHMIIEWATSDSEPSA